MSRYYAENGKFFYPDYSAAEERTVQSFKDSTDINKIVARFQKTGALSHLQKYGGEYGDLADFDYQTELLRVARAKEIFDELPGEVKREFGNDPSAFFKYAADPKNVNELATLLPRIAEPGSFFPKRGVSNPQAVSEGLSAQRSASTPTGGTGSPESGGESATGSVSEGS